MSGAPSPRPALEARDLRVRDLGERASIEVDAALLAGPLADDVVRRTLLDAVLAAGFEAADLDPRGFRSGSMNEALKQSVGE